MERDREIGLNLSFFSSEDLWSYARMKEDELRTAEKELAIIYEELYHRGEVHND